MLDRDPTLHYARQTHLLYSTNYCRSLLNTAWLAARP